VGETRRATIQEAARIMGVSEGAIRKRVKRNTLRHDKGPGGRVFVYLDAGVDDGVDEVSHPDSDALISEMRGRIEDLRAQLEAERQAHAEARRLLLSALEKIPPAIEGPTSEVARDTPEGRGPNDTPTEASRGPQTPSEARESPEMSMPGGGWAPKPTPSERPWWRFWG
jgi:hypothetical protein